MSGAAQASRDSSDAAAAPESLISDRDDEPGSLLAREFSDAWRRGECAALEEFLARRAGCELAPAVAVQLVCEEICLRQEAGESIDSAEILRRFPQWRAELELLLACYGLFQDEPQAEFPTAGEELGEFRLLAELGRGATGRVFLATQPSLSDRPVAIKFTSFEAAEHLSLSRLQHTGIVPLYLVQDFPERGLRALCMPYLGGASLDALLSEIENCPQHERSGRSFVEALARLRAPLPVSLPLEGPALDWLESLTYVQTVCWIGADLADALHYAHQRGLLHLDLKPSNVLLAGDGQPMLLDFHLARGPLAAQASADEWLGGTQGYMSPEQAAAVAAIRSGKAVLAAVDVRSDIYSLGVVLYEMLGGPPASSGAIQVRPAIRSLNPAVSRGLADLIDKCLASDPAARYGDAASLADDLRRHLADLPLRGLPNRSLSERWQKWRRRKPHSLRRLASSVILIAACVGGATAYLGRQVRNAQADLREADQLLDRRQFPAAIERLRAGAARLSLVPGHADLKSTFHSLLVVAQRRRRAEDLHQLVDRLRFLDGRVALSPAELREIEQGCPKIWQARDQILAEADGDEPDAERSELRTDLLDLGILWASFRFRAEQGANEQQSRAHALAVLDEAEATFGASPILAAERSAYLGESPPAQIGDKSAPPSVWEHYALGRFLLRNGRLEAAEGEFRQALQKAPEDFWPNYYSGLCAFRRGKFQQALTSFSICVALAPMSAERFCATAQADCLDNRGLAQAALGQSAEAQEDFSEALRLDPHLATAALHRGMLHGDAHHFEQAAADFQRALDHGAERAAVYYQWALLHLERKDRTSAKASLRKALEHSPADAEALELLQKLETP